MLLRGSTHTFTCGPISSIVVIPTDNVWDIPDMSICTKNLCYVGNLFPLSCPSLWECTLQEIQAPVISFLSPEKDAMKTFTSDFCHWVLHWVQGYLSPRGVKLCPEELETGHKQSSRCGKKTAKTWWERKHNTHLEKSQPAWVTEQPRETKMMKEAHIWKHIQSAVHQHHHHKAEGGREAMES